MKEGNPAIVALHGNLGCAGDWESLRLPNLRAISLWDDAALSLPAFAHKLAHELSDGLERPLLAGYSLGGRLALQAMAGDPERWSGAIILSAHPGLGSAEEKLARRISDSAWARDAREMSWHAFLEKWNRQAVFGEEAKITSEQLALESQRESIALAFENWSLGQQEDLGEKLRNFAAPVLWITGSEDGKFTTLAAEMQDVFPKWEHRIVSGVGHRLLSGEGTRLSGMICDFLGRLGW